MRFPDDLCGSFSGVISVKRRREILFQRAYGWADAANRVANHVDTKFPTASAGKGFVAAAILQLIERRLLSLDTPIGDLLAFDLHAVDRRITVRQLLNHTSGMADYFDETVMSDYSELWTDYPNYKIRTSKDLLPLFIHKPMCGVPGERFHYNNAGFVVLGLIIEAVTDMPFDSYLSEYVFAPAAMESTGYYELDRLPEKCANAYIFDASRREYYTHIFSVDAKGSGAGGAYTTVHDLEQFWDSLMNGRLVADAVLSEMLAPQVPEGCYGYGVWLDTLEDGRLAYHIEGSDPGVSCYSSYESQTAQTVTLVSNYGHNVWKIREAIEAWLEQ